MPCRSPGGGVVSQHALQVVSQHALQVSKPTLKGKLRGLARGVSSPTPKGGLQAHTQGGGDRPHPGG